MCCCSLAKSCPTLCNPMDCNTPGSYVLYDLLEFAQIYVHWVGVPSSCFILCHPFLLLPSIFPSISESALPVRWPKYRSFNFNISPSNEYSGLISFRIDGFDLLAVQGALRSLLQHHNSKASFFLRSALFMVQFSHPYTTTGKTITITCKCSLLLLLSHFSRVRLCATP